MIFPYGHVVATANCMSFAEQHGINLLAVLARHLACDWQDMSPEDQVANVQALTAGARIFSAYQLPQGRVWVITEAGRSSTCLLLPDDY
jgi:hypothetical protein